MLGIISDLHLTDGTTCKTISERAFRIFRNRLSDLAYEASWRASGGGGADRYEPITRLDLVLLGDIFDVIRSEQWPDVKETDNDYVRPWSKTNSPKFQQTVRGITAKIIENNAAALGVLRSLSEERAITLPPARNGRPVKVAYEPSDPKRQPVDIDIHYLVGNHDWFFHLPGEPFNDIRKAVKDALGLRTPADRPFPHDPFESELLMNIYRAHGVFARHGDIYDEHNFGGDRDASSLGDAIVVDLLNRFPRIVQRELGQIVPESFVVGLKELDNVRPMVALAGWIDGLLQRTCGPNSPVTKKVKTLWNDVISDFFKITFVAEQDTWWPGDVVDKLQAALQFTRWLSIESVANLADLVKQRNSSYRKHALSEQEFRNRNARFLVYGHTHHHEIVPLDLTLTDTGRLQQMYINSGTWRPVHDLAVREPDDREFIDYKVMTYCAFFKGDERGGQKFEAWSGALGVR